MNKEYYDKYIYADKQLINHFMKKHPDLISAYRNYISQLADSVAREIIDINKAINCLDHRFMLKTLSMNEEVKETGVTALKLHPCYCGGEMEIRKVAQDGGMDGTYWDWKLTCKKCGLTMTYAADGFYGRKYKTFEEAVDDWNRKVEENKK